MPTVDFRYELPPELIAQYPPDERGSSRLLELTAAGVAHGRFEDVVAHLEPGDLLVINNTRVIKARLYAQKDSGGQAEVLLERLLGEREALCQVRVSKPLKAGRALLVDGHELICLGREDQFYRLQSDIAFLDLLDRAGHVPLPPYIERHEEVDLDGERYQTVYSSVPGAVAAPTAGLHFTDEILARVKARGVGVAEVTLHVGAGTFQPVRGRLEDHVMHQEWYAIDETAAAAINATRRAGKRIVAVGTTVVRTLESAALAHGGCVAPGSAETQLFIKPGFEFQVTDALITNFHLPESTLLMLVCAFGGYAAVMQAYREAVAHGYHFFSYGDAMWLERSHV